MYNRTKYFVFILYLIVIFNSIIQSQVDTLWTKTFGGNATDVGESVQQTMDGGYIITGETYSFGAGGADVWLIKTDSYGYTSWTKTFGGGYGDHGSSVQQTIDGGYIITGNTESYGVGGGDVWLIKTDASGDTIWTKTFDCGNTSDYGLSVQQTFDGGYIITGDKFNFGTGYHDVLLIKTDSYGNTIWIKSFSGYGSESGRSVHQTTDGGYIITGNTSSFGAGDEDVWLLKTDANGDTLCTKTFGGSSRDWGNFVQQTKDNGFIITGYTESYWVGGGNVWLIKTTPDTTIVSVELTSFTATININEIILKWSTATETNNQGFEILRFAQNDNDWEAIGFVPGFGTTTEVHHYSFVDESVQPGNYQYRLKQIDFGGTFEYSNVINVTLNALTKFSLEQNFPNPFNPSTNIKYSVPELSNVTIKVFDILGTEVEALVNEEKPAGYYEVEFNASNLPSGVYFYQLKADSFIETKKMMLLK